MCGIVGFATNKNIDRKKVITNMTNLIKHRGPDGYGYFIDKKITLGHRRLSIIDINGGKQPFSYNGYTIIFNGEIYNYQKLKKNLERKNYTFQTNSDTEVLLKLYIEYKEKCLNKLNGMFSFAIYDKNKKNLFIARDRLGIKPLYYYIDNNTFIFSSEIKSILKFPYFQKKLNKKIINSYFQYRYIIGNETYFANIYSLLPGNYLNYHTIEKKMNIKKYWQIEAISNKQNLGETYYLLKVKKLLDESIASRMISDVPIGAYLSGGLDSSIVSAVMANNKKDGLHTFTIGFKEENFNEFKYSKLVSDMYGTNHHKIILSTEKYLENMEKLIEYKDAPLSVPNEVPLYLMSKELKKYITVVLSGEGADELFGGYGKIFISYLHYKKSNGSFMNYFLNKYNYVSDENINKFLSSDIKKQIIKYNYTQKIFKKYFTLIQKLDIEDKIPYIFQNIHLQGLLQRVDMTTMASSVEARVPFVDHKLIEFVNKMPFSYKIRWNDLKDKKKAIKDNLSLEKISENMDTTKYILRKVYENYLPKEIIKRKKMGFPVPLDNWFKGDFKQYAIKILNDKKTLNRNIFNDKYLKSKKYINELSGINIWMMCNLELFLRKYF